MRTAALLMIAFSIAGTFAPQSDPRPTIPATGTPVSISRDADAGKISGDLAALQNAYRSVSRGKGDPMATRRQELAEAYAISANDRNPVLMLLVQSRTALTSDQAARAGAILLSSSGGRQVVSVPMSRVPDLARIATVTQLDALKSRRVPNPRFGRNQKPAARGEIKFGSTNLNWNKGAATGKGVLVAVFDTGTDWRHPEFIKPDGTTRLKYLYDMSDESFAESGGKIGTVAPVKGADGKPIGTLYTEVQINAALKGTGTVNSKDNVGHGTACMSTAAGRKLDDMSSGVATEADLIGVKAMVKTPFGEQFSAAYPMAAQWVAAEAARMKKPVVMNMSFGSQYTNHLGLDSDELLLDSIVGKGKSGVAICVAAGNEGRESFHASGRFDPKKAGQINIEGEPIQVTVNNPEGATLQAYFSNDDDWGIALRPLQTIDGTDSKPYDVEQISVYRKEGKYFTSVKAPAGKTVPKELLDGVNRRIHILTKLNGEDRLEFTAPFGQFDVFPYGSTENVKVGTMSLFGADYGDISIGKGGSDEFMVGSPGNAANVITVGAYVAQNTWTNSLKSPTSINLLLGAMANFSSPGPRRDGLVKPEISAPGQYMISALADGAEMGLNYEGEKDTAFVLPDGKRVAWMGTSASTPYCAGVIALMLEKNPKLDSDQIKKILQDTATKDSMTRGTPNPYWGYGKLNPEGAVKAAAISFIKS